MRIRTCKSVLFAFLRRGQRALKNDSREKRYVPWKGLSVLFLVGAVACFVGVVITCLIGYSLGVGLMPSFWWFMAGTAMCLFITFFCDGKIEILEEKSRLTGKE